MHLKAGQHTLANLVAIGLLGGFFASARVSAEPVILQDATQQMTGVVDPGELMLEPVAIAVDGGGGPGKAIQAASAAQGGLARADRARNPSLETPQTKLVSQNSAVAPSGTKPGPDLAAEIRSTVKESVRPLHDQLLESGAADAWKELKSDLGLDKSKWDTDGTNGANPTTGRPDASDSSRWKDGSQPPKTEAQAQVDRELAAHMLEKLIDEVKPWAISMLGLYLLGYLIKGWLEHAQRKSIRRKERETARVLRRATEKTTRIKPEA